MGSNSSHAARLDIVKYASILSLYRLESEGLVLEELTPQEMKAIAFATIGRNQPSALKRAADDILMAYTGKPPQPGSARAGLLDLCRRIVHRESEYYRPDPLSYTDQRPSRRPLPVAGLIGSPSGDRYDQDVDDMWRRTVRMARQGLSATKPKAYLSSNRSAYECPCRCHFHPKME